MTDKECLLLIGGLIAGLVIGAGISFYSMKADLQDQDKTITKLQLEVKQRPIITVEDVGICRVKSGGQEFMLIDITEQMRGTKTTTVEADPYRALEQEIDILEKE